LRQASGHHQLFALAFGLDRGEDFLDGLFLGGFDETAGIDDGDGGLIVLFLGEDESGAAELAQDVFAIDLVLGTTQVQQADFGGRGNGGGSGRIRVRRFFGLRGDIQER